MEQQRIGPYRPRFLVVVVVVVKVVVVTIGGLRNDSTQAGRLGRLSHPVLDDPDDVLVPVDGVVLVLELHLSGRKVHHVM